MSLKSGLRPSRSHPDYLASRPVERPRIFLGGSRSRREEVVVVAHGVPCTRQVRHTPMGRLQWFTRSGDAEPSVAAPRPARTPILEPGLPPDQMQTPVVELRQQADQRTSAWGVVGSGRRHPLRRSRQTSGLGKSSRHARRPRPARKAPALPGRTPPTMVALASSYEPTPRHGRGHRPDLTQRSVLAFDELAHAKLPERLAGDASLYGNIPTVRRETRPTQR